MCWGRGATRRDRRVYPDWEHQAGEEGIRWALQPAHLPGSPLPRCQVEHGVIMYTLLAGSLPFWHRKQMLMLRMIMSGNYRLAHRNGTTGARHREGLARGRTCWRSGSGEGKSSVPGVRCRSRGSLPGERLPA